MARILPLPPCSGHGRVVQISWQDGGAALAALGFCTQHPAGASVHLIQWDFLPAEEHLAEFLAAYGDDGDWVRLFRRGAGYLGTELLPMPGLPGWYRCIDRWGAEWDYAVFRREYAAEYQALDRRCERYTRQEVPAWSDD
jgi:hypothetical protein